MQQSISKGRISSKGNSFETRVERIQEKKLEKPKYEGISEAGTQTDRVVKKGNVLLEELLLDSSKSVSELYKMNVNPHRTTQ